MSISAIILTANNEETVLAALHSVAFVDEIIVVDDYSTDRTYALVENLASKQTYNLTYGVAPFPPIYTFQRHLNNNFAAQRNFALSKAHKRWVIYLDADERIEVDLRTEIQTVVARDEAVNGYLIKRQDLFMGRVLRYGETGTIRLLRLARRIVRDRTYRMGQWQGRVHERLLLPPPYGSLGHPILHERTLTLSEFLERTQWYALIQAQQFLYDHRKESIWLIGLYPVGKFCHNFILKKGFLDGFPGFCIAWLMSWHSLLVRLQLRLLWVEKEPKEPPLSQRSIP